MEELGNLNDFLHENISKVSPALREFLWELAKHIEATKAEVRAAKGPKTA